jgi:hypothetical protein
MQVIHSNNMNNKLFYAYNANNECFDFLMKISQIVENMDFLYV